LTLANAPLTLANYIKIFIFLSHIPQLVEPHEDIVGELLKQREEGM
jgi:hypothetical protein